MNVHHYPGRTAAAIAAAVLLACTSTPAQAATTATASTAAQQTVGSGSWGAVATVNTTAPYGPLTLTFNNNGNPAHPSFTSRYFTIANTGTLTITAANYTGTASAPSTVQFIVESCSTAWNEPTDTCPGTPTQILAPAPGSSSSTVTTTTVPASPGAQIRLRARVSTSGNVPKSSTSTLTIGITVDSTQVRDATTTGG
ncbi:hypothetical protein OIT41_20535 (plasmid) [Arthrobacter sp. YA7-1]|uniref:hypothetical protein n=1 Tax=Arthrobacter sp. YA7-1 TaxID=2987701 RepID=UPI002225F0A6|nr:hypothetical protein [Arthrobacter sp. YA7-1]UYY83737.1 hypothetical protein OIT41_20535 [Arthrobacter sp. YA7-1]